MSGEAASAQSGDPLLERRRRGRECSGCRQRAPFRRDGDRGVGGDGYRRVGGIGVKGLRVRPRRGGEQG